MNFNIGVLGITLILFALLITGCSQLEEVKPKTPRKFVEKGKQFAENISQQVEIEEVYKLLVNQKEQLIEKANELDFNPKILIALFEELEKNPFNQEIIELLKFHADALMEETTINESHKKLADVLADEIKAIGRLTKRSLRITKLSTGKHTGSTILQKHLMKDLEPKYLKLIYPERILREYRELGGHLVTQLSSIHTTNYTNQPKNCQAIKIKITGSSTRIYSCSWQISTS